MRMSTNTGLLKSNSIWSYNDIMKHSTADIRKEESSLGTGEERPRARGFTGKRQVLMHEWITGYILCT